MKKITLFLSLLLAGFISSLPAQTQFWVDDFEGTNSSSGLRTPENNGGVGGPPFTSYFCRTPANGTVNQAVAFTGFQGSNYWAGEDHDAAGTGFAGAGTSAMSVRQQDITWTSINIAGKTNLSFTGSLAANSTNQPFDNRNACSGGATTNTDYVIVQYRIDAGPWNDGLRFFTNGALTGKYLYQETTGDSCGDGAELLNTFADYTFNIIGTGTTLDLRLLVYVEGSNEEWGADNFRLFEVASCTAPTIIANPPNRSICAGNNTSFSTSASGATTYQWQVNQGSGFTDLSNGAPYSGVTTSTLLITGATAGMNGYQYRAVAINGVATCFTNSSPGTLSISSISTASNAQTNISCFGGSNGSASVSPSGGIGGYTYSWSPSGGTGQIASGLSAGNYTLTVTDGIGCTASKTFTISQPTAPISGTTVTTNVACFGGSNGAINLTPSGGTPGYTFNWLPSGPTTEDRTGLVAGTYSVQITDANACTGTVTVTVNQPTTPVSGTTVTTNVSCFGGSNGAINLTPTGGTPGYTFNWLPSGPTTEDRTGLVAGTYSVQITDANACTGTVTVTVNQPTTPISGTTVTTNVACFGGSNGAINLTPTGGTPGYTFNWLPSGPTTEDRTGLSAGTYSVQITDANGCTGMVTVTVTQPTTPVSGTTVVTNVSCFGGSNGAINLTPSGGTPGYTFNWLPSGPTTEDRTGLVAGTYSVQITDANACTGTVTVTVTQPTTPVSGTTVVTNVACFGGNTGAINLTPTGGTPGYTFNWLPSGPTTEDRTGLVAGTYSVQITDANGCTGTVTVTVTQPTTPVSGTTVVTNVACFGGNTGAINLTPTGGTPGYTFNWLPSGPTTEDRTGLVAGTYSVQITDANGCTGTVTVTVTQPTTPVSGTTVTTNVSCFGGSNGAINLTPTGGTPGYTFNWLPSGPTTEDRTGLVAGTYSVQITDANGCTGTVTVTVTQPTTPVSGTTVTTNVACFGGSNGAINLTPTGGTPGYTFNWLPSGPTTEDRTGLSAGTYSVQITDANGCTGTVTVTVNAPTAISFTASSQTNVSCFGGSNGAAAMNAATGGTGTKTYDWTPGTPTGDGTTSVTGLTAGSWTCTATDANGCTASQVFTITAPSAISFTAASQTNVSCFGGSNGAAAMNAATGGTGTKTYDWTPGTPTGDGTTSVTGLTAGSWTCTATDANGCTASQVFTVTEPSLLSITTSQTNVTCNGAFTGSATGTVTGGTAPYVYSWSPAGGSGSTANGLPAGTYTLFVSDANGCSASSGYTITQEAAAVSSVSATACSSYTLNGTTYTSSGTYTQVLTGASATGCDSTITLNLVITQPTSATVNATACSSYTLNGITYTSSGTYTQVLTGANAAGCDSTITLSLTINQPSTSTISATGCSSYTLNGTTYTSSGTYTQLLTNAAGCDSTLTLSLTINQPSTSTISATGCSSYTLNGTTYTSSGTYTQMLTNAAGCDSTLTLSLTINQPSTSAIAAIACGSYTLNGTTYTSSGTYTQMLTNAAGCDSTLTLSLTINQPSTSTISATGCSSYTLNGTTYTSSGTYTQLLTNTAGCDSTLTLSLTINHPSTSTISATGCSSYTLNGTTYTSSGTYTQTLTNAAGCDSTLTLSLTINQPSTSTISATGCSSYTLNGTTYTSSGTYTQTLTNAAGCDSTIMLSLTINQLSTSTITASACNSYTLNGTTYTSSGTYTQMLTNAAGCDSVLTLSLTIGAAIDTSVTINGPVATANATGASYQWLDCNNGSAPIAGETNQSFTAPGTGNYAVVITYGACSDTSSCQPVYVEGLRTINTSLAGNVYPNPSAGIFTIELRRDATITITNALGAVVRKEEMNAGTAKIDLSNEANGVYFMQLTGKGSMQTIKLVKQD